MKFVCLSIFVTFSALLIFSATLSLANPDNLENAESLSAAEPEFEQLQLHRQIRSNSAGEESRSNWRATRVRRAPGPQPQGNLRSVHITPGGTVIIPDGNPNVYIHGRNPYRYSLKCRAYGIGCGK